jgi:hypothetical protein
MRVTGDSCKANTGPRVNQFIFQFQACLFRASEGGIQQYGIARLNCGWGSYDVAYIVDTGGNKVKEIWDYKLLDGPNCYMQMGF